MYQMKEQEKNFRKDLMKQISNLLIDFKVMIIKIPKEHGRRMDENRISTKKRRKYQTQVTGLKNTIIDLKNQLEGFNSRLDETEEWISNLEDRAVELTENSKKKNNFEK